MARSWRPGGEEGSARGRAQVSRLVRAGQPAGEGEGRRGWEALLFSRAPSLSRKPASSEPAAYPGSPRSRAELECGKSARRAWAPCPPRRTLPPSSGPGCASVGHLGERGSRPGLGLPGAQYGCCCPHEGREACWGRPGRTAAGAGVAAGPPRAGEECAAGLQPWSPPRGLAQSPLPTVLGAPRGGWVAEASFLPTLCL